LNALLAAAILAIASVASPSLPASTPAFVVHIKDFKYAPTPLKIHVGDTVRFINDDDEPHTVTATDKSFDSEALDTSGAWTYTFTKPGTYSYFCELHPYMKATVVVIGDTGGPRRNVGAGARSDVFGAIVPNAAWSATHPATWGAL
jgi:plastocyanin